MSLGAYFGHVPIGHDLFWLKKGDVGGGAVGVQGEDVGQVAALLLCFMGVEGEAVFLRFLPFPLSCPPSLQSPD